MNTIFDGYRKLEDLKKEQLDNYVNKAKLDEKKKKEEPLKRLRESMDKSGFAEGDIQIQ